MPKPIQISIPKPCHENWESMTPTEKGRFCAACQKNVHDFTKSSDREIASVLKNQKNACGRFRIDQLDRDLIIPKEKNKFWVAASSAVVAFIGLGTNEATAQDAVRTEQHQTDKATIEKDTVSVQGKLISGVVSDIVGPLPSASVLNRRTQQYVMTDIDGKYSIEATEGDILIFNYLAGTEMQSIEVDNCTAICDVMLMADELEVVMDVYGRPEVKRKFFGRIFYSIRNWFR